MQNPRHRCDYGRANTSDSDTWQHRLQAVDPTLLARKGHLHVLCTADVDAATLDDVYRRFYADPCYDTIPSVRDALAAALSASSFPVESIPLAVVVRELEAFIVGTRESAVWLSHIDRTSDVLARGYPLPPQPSLILQNTISGPTWFGTRQRLMAGDTLVLTTARVAQSLGERRIHRLVQRSSAPQTMARRIARAAHGRGQPVLVISRAALHPMPDMGPTQRVPISPVHRAEKQRERRWSPVWLALLVAVISVGGVMWAEKPTASRQDLINLVRWIVSPEPTATEARSTEVAVAGLVANATARPVQGASPVAARPTHTPKKPPSAQPAAVATSAPPTATPTTKVYESVDLDTPHEGQNMHGRHVELRWSWEGTLAEDEFFDVRLWRLGTPKTSIAWTKEPYYTERHRSNGWHTWTVAVIKGRDGLLERELAPEAEPINFDWDDEIADSSSPKETDPPAPTAAPTRVTPAGRPTRVTPEAGRNAPSRALLDLARGGESIL